MSLNLTKKCKVDEIAKSIGYWFISWFAILFVMTLLGIDISDMDNAEMITLVIAIVVGVCKR